MSPNATVPSLRPAANELGESFRPVLPAMVVPSYCVSFGYVLVDTWDKTNQALSRSGSVPIAAGKAVDTLLWQTMASVVIPGFTINRSVELAGYLLQRAKAPAHVLRWGPVGIGLGIIPLIIHPFDAFVHFAMDNTTRPLTARLLGKGSS